MPRLPDLASGFNTLREIDLNKIRTQAEQPFHIAIIGGAGVGKSTLINQFLEGPGLIDTAFLRPVSEYQLNEEIFIQSYNLVILVLDASRPEQLPKNQTLDKLRSSHIPIIVCYNKVDLIQNSQVIFNDTLDKLGKASVAISADARETVIQKLVPPMISIFKGREILLARHLPLFREPVSQKLIEDTSFINAAYSLTSGLAEINLFLTLPLNAADMVILTKNQALMAYKIALAFDLPSEWRQTIPKLSAVVGAGFLWRTIARQLVGLIPAIGVIPKVAVSYAGTYAIGQAIYRWCANNEKVNPQTFKALYSRAMTRGQEVARTLLSRRNTPKIDLTG